MVPRGPTRQALRTTRGNLVGRPPRARDGRLINAGVSGEQDAHPDAAVYAEAGRPHETGPAGLTGLAWVQVVSVVSAPAR
ncbi:hypothetical protein SAMN02745673_05018 [Marinactinospora thermotolerans DSM 45154]|uniref:Uncharacterized protein n=1 Tax=Marinactinospora thermotolerans DSM 45154 TaxID=1122192 RepID=A0A1T4TH68_9ACTN|nr:hypothetical protein SAMN02745673_05018 [Marinactinospora thermotolerans DSM 45154]